MKPTIEQNSGRRRYGDFRGVATTRSWDRWDFRMGLGMANRDSASQLRNALVEACKVGTVLLIEDGLMEVKVTEHFS